MRDKRASVKGTLDGNNFNVQSINTAATKAGCCGWKDGFPIT